MWTSIAAGLALFVGVAGWNVQQDVFHMFAPQAGKSVASVSNVSTGAVAPATLQISYALSSVPNASTKAAQSAE
jgi:hypothetical protein